MLRALNALALLACLAACDRVEAPGDAGVCWRMHPAVQGGAASFQAAARNIDGLETCAVLLEAMHLRGEAKVQGAYQGNFIFVDDSGIRSSQTQNGFHYPIFQPEQRASIDKDLKQIMAARGGKMPDAGDLNVERR